MSKESCLPVVDKNSYQNTPHDKIFFKFAVKWEIKFVIVPDIQKKCSIIVSFLRYCIRLLRSSMLSTFCTLYQFQISYIMMDKKSNTSVNITCKTFRAYKQMTVRPSYMLNITKSTNPLSRICQTYRSM